MVCRVEADTWVEVTTNVIMSFQNCYDLCAAIANTSVVRSLGCWVARARGSALTSNALIVAPVFRLTPGFLSS